MVKKYISSRDFFEIIGISAVIILLLFTFFWPVEIIGNSMQESFNDGDKIFISRALVYVGWLDYGDVVVFKYSRDEMHIIKRIVGMPGDTVVIRNGVVRINGRIVPSPQDATSGDLDVVLYDNEFFLLGDNRAASYDSRQFGPVTKSMLTGKVIMKGYPLKALTVY